MDISKVRKYISLSNDGGIIVHTKQKDVISFIKANAEEIRSILKAEKAAEDEALRIRQQKIDSIEGLKVLKNNISEWEKYSYMINKYISNGALGSAPSKPEIESSELKKKFPRAAAYIKAESYAYASNAVKSSIGKDALDKIIDGCDYSVVISDMEEKWKNHLNTKDWD
ncbi:MAG: hypothetical protein ACI4RG_05120 [Huintestinicola sp.]